MELPQTRDDRMQLDRARFQDPADYRNKVHCKQKFCMDLSEVGKIQYRSVAIKTCLSLPLDWKRGANVALKIVKK